MYTSKKKGKFLVLRKFAYKMSVHTLIFGLNLVFCLLKRLLTACVSSDCLFPMITFHSESNEVNNNIELKYVYIIY